MVGIWQGNADPEWDRRMRRTQIIGFCTAAYSSSLERCRTGFEPSQLVNWIGGEAFSSGIYVGTLLAYAEELGDLEEASGDLRHSLALLLVSMTHALLPRCYLRGWRSLRFRWLARLDSNQD